MCARRFEQIARFGQEGFIYLIGKKNDDPTTLLNKLNVHNCHIKKSNKSWTIIDHETSNDRIVK